MPESNIILNMGRFVTRLIVTESGSLLEQGLTEDAWNLPLQPLGRP